MNRHVMCTLVHNMSQHVFTNCMMHLMHIVYWKDKLLQFDGCDMSFNVIPLVIS